MNIILIGMRGSGKSTVGKALAKKMDKSFIDMDRLIAVNVGMSLPDFVNRFGWDTFRQKESEIAIKTSNETNAVIATGGGVILKKSNINTLRRNSKFVFLKTSINQMFERIKNAKDRPALTDKNTLMEELEEVWKERKSLYENTADIIIETDNKTINQIADEIVSKLKF